MSANCVFVLACERGLPTDELGISYWRWANTPPATQGTSERRCGGQLRRSARATKKRVAPDCPARLPSDASGESRTDRKGKVSLQRSYGQRLAVHGKSKEAVALEYVMCYIFNNV